MNVLIRWWWWNFYCWNCKGINERFHFSTLSMEREFFFNFQHNLLAWAYVCILLLLLLPNTICYTNLFSIFKSFVWPIDKIFQKKKKKKRHNNKNFKLYTAPKTRHTRTANMKERGEIKNTTTPIGYTSSRLCVRLRNKWMNERMNEYFLTVNAMHSNEQIPTTVQQ